MKPFYEEKGITIYHGKAEDVLPGLPSSSVDLVFTSPPYNLGEGMEDKGGLRIGHKGSAWPQAALVSGYDEFDDAIPYEEYKEQQRGILHSCWRVITDAGAIYYNHKPRVVKGVLRTPLAWIDLPIRQIIIWDRLSGFNHQSGAYKPAHEWIVVIAKEKFLLRDKSSSNLSDVWKVPADSGNPHPAPFPVELPKRAISTTRTNTVLDPYMGSGSTLRAAKDAGVNAIGIDSSEMYCEMAARRLAQSAFCFEPFSLNSQR